MIIALRRRKIGVAVLLMLAIVAMLSDCGHPNDTGYRMARDAQSVISIL